MPAARGAKTQTFIQNVCENYSQYNRIDPDLYVNENIKRGLRHADGTGVLVGLTRVGSVQGYIVRDGERIPIDGRLIYRGIDVEELVAGFDREKRFGFEETCFLLLFGYLPDDNRLEEFEAALEEARILPEYFTEDMIIKAPSPDVMNKLARAILSLYSYDEHPDDATLHGLMRQSISLIARVPVIVAHAYAVKRHYYDHESLILHYPMSGLSISENFLRAVRPDGKFTPEEARLLDLCMVLHAEHGGGNNSAFSCRVLTSSGTDTYAALAAAVGSLKGPRHGGANAKVMDMFYEISRELKDWTDDEAVADYLGKIIRKEAGDGSGLIYGMGHAVYTLSDPRAILLKRYAKQLAARQGMLEEFLLMESVERLSPEVFARVKGDAKVICANVDMYSGLVYRMLGIPEALYTPLFAVARTVGWCAHRIEEALTGNRIIRPAYRSVAGSAAYIPLSER
ncbi:MAG: citrate/2-methylcitrate synthase [Oscillospiraceae bacterium]|jgi:citrate synthase|nr:citrate/2-methylcitrate synthase [Oscillospiraceae bacterium]